MRCLKRLMFLWLFGNRMHALVSEAHILFLKAKATQNSEQFEAYRLAHTRKYEEYECYRQLLESL